VLTLYHCPRARSFRVLWMLEELALAYELKLLPFPPRVHAREYLALNPLGTVPLLLDGAMRMTESSAICQYLARRFSPQALDVAADHPAHPDYLTLLSFGEATLMFPLAIVMRYTRLEAPARQLPQAAEDYKRFFLGRVLALEQLVPAGDYLCAGRFTAADVSVGYALLFAERHGLREELPAWACHYLDRLKERPAFRRALAAEQAQAPS